MDNLAISDRLFDNGIEEESFLTAKQLGEKLQVSYETVRRWSRQYRRFPIYRLGKTNRYKLSEVVKYFERKRPYAKKKY